MLRGGGRRGLLIGVRWVRQNRHQGQPHVADSSEEPVQSRLVAGPDGEGRVPVRFGREAGSLEPGRPARRRVSRDPDPVHAGVVHGLLHLVRDAGCMGAADELTLGRKPPPPHRPEDQFGGFIRGRCAGPESPAVTRGRPRSQEAVVPGPGDRLDPVLRPELPADGVDMRLDRAQGEVELFCDLAIGAPEGHEAEHLELPITE